MKFSSLIVVFTLSVVMAFIFHAFPLSGQVEAAKVEKEEWAIIETHYWWYCDPDRTQECLGIVDGLKSLEQCERVVKSILTDGNPNGSQFYCAKHMNGNKFRERVAKAQKEHKTLGEVLKEEGVDVNAGRPKDFKGECH